MPSTFLGRRKGNNHSIGDGYASDSSPKGETEGRFPHGKIKARGGSRPTSPKVASETPSSPQKRGGDGKLKASEGSPSKAQVEKKSWRTPPPEAAFRESGAGPGPASSAETDAAAAAAASSGSVVNEPGTSGPDSLEGRHGGAEAEAQSEWRSTERKDGSVPRAAIVVSGSGVSAEQDLKAEQRRLLAAPVESDAGKDDEDPSIRSFVAAQDDRDASASVTASASVSVTFERPTGRMSTSGQRWEATSVRPSSVVTASRKKRDGISPLASDLISDSSCSSIGWKHVLVAVGMLSVIGILALLLYLSAQPQSAESCHGGPMAACHCLLRCDIFAASPQTCEDMAGRKETARALVDQLVREAMTRPQDTCSGMQCIASCAKVLKCFDQTIKHDCSAIKHLSEKFFGGAGCDIFCDD